MASGRQTLAILGGIAVLAIFAAIAWLSRGSPTAPTKVYCGPDGRLTVTAPVQSHRSFCVRAYTSAEGLEPNTPVDFAFDIVDDRGETLEKFATVHEKIMHVIVVRNDLTQFQHVHPTFSKQQGRFTVAALTVPADGPYRLFADFTPAEVPPGASGELLPVTRSVDLSVGDPRGYTPEAWPEPVESVATGEYQVTIGRPDTLRAAEEAELTFTVRRDGKAVEDLEPYLGANGHAVILRADDLAFLHSHALEDRAALRAGRLPFMAHFSEPGRYRAFVQFQIGGVVRTATFTLPTVVAGNSSPSDPHTGH